MYCELWRRVRLWNEVLHASLRETPLRLADLHLNIPLKCQ